MSSCNYKYDRNKTPSKKFLRYIKDHFEKNLDWNDIDDTKKKNIIKYYENHNLRWRNHDDCWYANEKNEMLENAGIAEKDFYFEKWLKLPGNETYKKIYKKLEYDEDGQLSHIIKEYKDNNNRNANVTKNKIGPYTELQFTDTDEPVGGKRKRKTLKRKRSKKTKKVFVGKNLKKRTKKHHKTRRRRGGEDTTKNLKKTVENLGDGTTKILSTGTKRTLETANTGIDRSFDIVKGALNATKIVSSTLDQTGNIGQKAVEAVGDTSTSALSATGKIAKTTLDETGNSGSKLVGTIVKGTFTLPNDLLVASGNLWRKVKDNIKKKELSGLCNERIKVIQLTMREINKMLNIDSWVKKITKDGENEGWIPECGYIRCSSGRKSIIIVIRSILQSVLFQGKQLNNLTMLKVNFNDYSNKMNGIKKQINLKDNDVSYDSKKITIINDLNNLNTDIKKSFTQFSNIVKSMSELATPEIFKLRASISQEELDKQLSKMSTQEKKLYESVIAPKPLIEGANTIPIQKEVNKIKENEGIKLEQEIAEVNTEMEEKNTHLGGRRRSSKKRSRKSKRKMTKRRRH